MTDTQTLLDSVLGAFSAPGWSRFVMTLAHTLWQSAIIALLLVVVLKFVTARKASLRYGLCCAALLTVVISSVLTWAWLSHDDERTERIVSVSALAETPNTSETRLNSATELSGPDADSTDKLDERPPLRSTIDGIPVEPYRPEPSGSEFWSLEMLSPIVAMAWIIGFGAMFTRLVTQLWAGHRLCRTQSPADSETTLLVNQLARQLGIGKRICVLLTEQIQTPAIMGAFWPVLLLPGSMITGLSAEQLRVVLIHELAHVRRHDYLVNLGQMLIESILFFNPAVWWVSRQLRIEREACADAVAVSLTDNRLGYATILATFAERLVGTTEPELAQAFAGQGGGRSLADRVRRVLSPSAVPSLRIHWTSFCGILTLSCAALFAAEKGAQVVVEVAAQLLTPEERMEVLIETRDQITEAASVVGPATRRVLRGSVETDDGSRIPDHVSGHVQLPAERYGATFSLLGDKSAVSRKFSCSLPYGDAYIHLWVEGYAPATLGPIPQADGLLVDGLKLVLRRRSPAEIVLQDERGQPVVGAEITGGYRFAGRRQQRLKLTSNAHGGTQVDHPGELPNYELKIRGSGYEMLSVKNVLLDPEKPHLIRMKKARPTTGTIVDSNGEPIANAKIQLFGSETDEADSYRPDWYDEELAVTDSRGNFTLDTLLSGHRYKLEVQTESQGRYIIENIRAGQIERLFKLPPEMVFQGTVTGDLDRILLKKSEIRGFSTKRRNELIGTPGLRYTVEEFGNEGLIRGPKTIPVSMENGVGKFEIKNLIPGILKLHGGDRSTSMRLTESVRDFNFHIDDGSTRGRKVILKFDSSDGMTPEGTILVHVRRPDPSSSSLHEFLSIKDGTVEVDCFAPGKVFYEAHRVVGYGFDRRQLTIDAGRDVIRHTVPVFPAGAISGLVRDYKGRPVPTSVRVNFGTIEQAPHSHWPARIWGYPEVKQNGEYFLSPIPLGGSYYVYALRDYMFAAVGPVHVNAEKPSAKVNIVMPQGVHIRGKVVDRFNRTLSGIPVRYNLSHFTLSHGMLPVDTDQSGEFSIGPINPNVREHSVYVNSRKNYQSARVIIDDLQEPIVVKLELGLRAAGVVLDEASGWPIPNAEVYAQAEDYQFNCEAETRTDAKGRFRFSNLPAKRMKFMVRGTQPYNAPHGTIASEPGNMKITFRVKATSELRPRKPD